MMEKLGRWIVRRFFYHGKAKGETFYHLPPEVWMVDVKRNAEYRALLSEKRFSKKDF